MRGFLREFYFEDELSGKTMYEVPMETKRIAIISTGGTIDWIPALCLSSTSSNLTLGVVCAFCVLLIFVVAPHCIRNTSLHKQWMDGKHVAGIGNRNLFVFAILRGRGKVMKYGASSVLVLSVLVQLSVDLQNNDSNAVKALYFIYDFLWWKPCKQQGQK